MSVDIEDDLMRRDLNHLCLLVCLSSRPISLDDERTKLLLVLTGGSNSVDKPPNLRHDFDWRCITDSSSIQIIWIIPIIIALTY